MKYSKYKDASPEETIKTIKKIYDEKLGLKLKLNVSFKIVPFLKKMESIMTR